MVAMHSNRWSKYAFSTFFVQNAQKERKRKKIEAKLSKKCFSEFTPKYWPRILFSENSKLTNLQPFLSANMILHTPLYENEQKERKNI